MKKQEEFKEIKNKTFVTAYKHAVDGIILAFKTERNLRIDYIIGLFVLIFSLFFDFTKTEFACICLTIGFVIFSEMINTTVEYIVDLITEEYNEKAKAAKDIAAGGVLVSSTVSVVVAYFMFADKIYNSTNTLLNTISGSKIYLLFTILFASVILSVIVKGIFTINKLDSNEKSYPSLRIVVAFALTTYLFLVTKSLLVTTVSAILSMMIAQIRIENSKVKLAHLILSISMGILIVLMVYQLVLLKPNILQFLSKF